MTAAVSQVATVDLPMPSRPAQQGQPAEDDPQLPQPADTARDDGRGQGGAQPSAGAAGDRQAHLVGDAADAVHELVDVAGGVVGELHDALAGLHEAATDGVGGDDLGVVRGVRRRRDRGQTGVQVGQTTDPLQLAAPLQLGADRDGSGSTPCAATPRAASRIVWFAGR